jgi:hypothetical protein
MDAVLCEQQCHAAAHAAAANHGNLRWSAPVCRGVGGLLTVLKLDMASEGVVLLGVLPGSSGDGQREGENEDVEVGERGKGRERGVSVVDEVVEEAKHDDGMVGLCQQGLWNTHRFWRPQNDVGVQVSPVDGRMASWGGLGWQPRRLRDVREGRHAMAGTART